MSTYGADSTKRFGPDLGAGQVQSLGAGQMVSLAHPRLIPTLSEIARSSTSLRW